MTKKVEHTSVIAARLEIKEKRDVYPNSNNATIYPTRNKKQWRWNPFARNDNQRDGGNELLTYKGYVKVRGSSKRQSLFINNGYIMTDMDI